MKFIVASICIISLAAFLHDVGLTAAAVATGNHNVAPVGLYAPDRYDGIPDMCLMPMDFGYCRAKVKRYYFDMRRMKCAMFYWGGCAGNINNFKSQDECNKVCTEGLYVDDNSDDVSPNSNNNVANTRKYKNKVNSNSNYRTYNNNNNNNNSKNNGTVVANNNNNNNNGNYKNDNRRFSDSARTVDKNDDFENDEDEEYSNN